MLARARLCLASLTKVSLIDIQARPKHGRTRGGASVSAPPPDFRCHTHLVPAASYQLPSRFLPLAWPHEYQFTPRRMGSR